MYDVIVIDPPWPIQKVKRRVRPNQKEMDYSMMSIDDIKSLNVANLANDNCMVFMWQIDKFLYESKEILEEWGFKYHLTLAWDKGNGMSLAGFNRRTEYVVVGYKGKLEMYPKRKTVKTSFSAKSTGHSVKPDLFYEMLEVIPGKKVDVFARKQREGWDVLGNEIDGQDIRSVLDEYAQVLKEPSETC